MFLGLYIESVVFLGLYIESVVFLAGRATTWCALACAPMGLRFLEYTTRIAQLLDENCGVPQSSSTKVYCGQTSEQPNSRFAVRERLVTCTVNFSGTDARSRAWKASVIA